MCDVPHHQSQGWAGWPSWPPAPEMKPIGSWHDLSHALNENIPVPKIFPSPSFSRVKTIPQDILNVTRIDMVCHLGTHIDAPAHVMADGPTIESIPQHYFHGAGVVWQFNPKPCAAITANDLQLGSPKIRRGDILFLSTGWAKLFGQESYFNNPYLSEDAADWIVANGIKCVGIDFVSPELPFALRPPSFSYPIHRRLLGQGVLVIENLADCSHMGNSRVEIICGALKIDHADGSPAWIFARSVS